MNPSQFGESVISRHSITYQLVYRSILHELIFEVNKEEVDSYKKIIKDEMTSVKDSDLHSFSIPLSVDVNVGYNWGDLH